MAEWSKAPDSKSGLGQPNGGSNPSLSARLRGSGPGRSGGPLIGDDDIAIVKRVSEVGQPTISPWRGRIHFGRRLHGQRLAGSLAIEFLNEGIEAGLLLQAAHGWRAGGTLRQKVTRGARFSRQRHWSGKWNEYCVGVDRLLGGKPGHGPGSQLIFRPSGA
jgi:hypothetical protein